MYHADDGASFVNIGWGGTISSVTGVSSRQIAISEIGASTSVTRKRDDADSYAHKRRELPEAVVFLEDQYTSTYGMAA